MSWVGRGLFTVCVAEFLVTIGSSRMCTGDKLSLFPPASASLTLSIVLCPRLRLRGGGRATGGRSANTGEGGDEGADSENRGNAGYQQSVKEKEHELKLRDVVWEKAMNASESVVAKLERRMRAEATADTGQQSDHPDDTSVDVSSFDAQNLPCDADEALFEAADEGDVAAIEASIEAGASVNAGDPFTHNFTPLHFMAAKEHLDACRRLLALGADVNAVTTNLETPLHVAALSGSVPVCACLVEFGADLGARDRWHKTPYTVAKESGLDNVSEYLRSVGAPGGGEDHLESVRPRDIPENAFE